jgi:hypothetical protein
MIQDLFVDMDATPYEYDEDNIAWSTVGRTPKPSMRLRRSKAKPMH